MTEKLRLDRQLRIPSWRQEPLSQARIGVVGEADPLTSLFLLGTAALGINEVVVLAPALAEPYLQLARSLNPAWRLLHLSGYLSHPAVLELLEPCGLWVNLSPYRLADKILLDAAPRRGYPVVRARLTRSPDQGYGWRLFSYLPGREWQELLTVMAPDDLPGAAPVGDGVLAIIVAGLILEEVKNILWGQPPTPELLSFREREPPAPIAGRIAIVGAGALGNFVALGLLLAGAAQITIIDPDVVEITNLNRQVLLGGAVGQPKALALAAALRRLGAPAVTGQVAFFNDQTEVTAFDLVFDCVDNFASRLAISRRCQAAGVPLVSGGTDYARGQVVCYHPRHQPQTVAELLDLERLAAQAESGDRRRAACIYQPEPAVIMTNQIIGGFMVEAGRRLLADRPPVQVFYEATAPQRYEIIEWDPA